MKLLNFTVIKLTVSLIIGILLGYCFEFNLYFLIALNSISLVILLVVLLLNSTSKKPIWIGMLIYLNTIAIGCLVSKTHDQINFKNHYSKIINNKSDSALITFRVKEVLKPGKFYSKYVIDIFKIDDRTVIGRSLLNVSIDATEQPFKVDEIFITKSQFKELIPPLNPHQFDYKSYLKKQYIYHQLFIDSHELLKISSRKHTLYGYASKLREHINKKLDLYNFKRDELAIINALLLGQRQDISKEIYDSYTQAGAIHILAVSGLHVGIILYLLNFLFKPIEYIKHGKIIKTILLIIILWSFAIIAGLSASVVRAVSMFTIVAIALNLERPTNVYNTLTISMFFLLLFKPNFLFDVGFQLSYLAVFAIVSFQPILYNLWPQKNKIGRFFWNIFTVTISAQFGIIPISLYYFHQFPGLFFVSNLVIIPFLGSILGLGLVIIGLSLVNLLPNFLATAFGFIISSMNTFVTWIAEQESFLFKNISFSIEQVIMSYLLIIITLIVLKRKTYKTLTALLLIVVFGQIYYITTKYFKTKNAFIVFHKSKQHIIGFKKDHILTLHTSLKDSTISKDKMITNYTIGASIKTITPDSLKLVYQFDNRTVLVIDSMNVYNVASFKPDIIILQQSPKINLKRVITTLQPELIISDGSNYKSYQDRWESTCKAQKIPFHRTSKKGAFIYRY